MAFWDGTRFLSEAPTNRDTRHIHPLVVLAAAASLMVVVTVTATGLPGSDGPPGNNAPIAVVPVSPIPRSHAPSASAPVRPRAVQPARTNPRPFATATPTPAPVRSTPRPTPKPTPKPVPPPRLLFGLGPEADGALRLPVVDDAPVHMLTSWYNGPGDLAWMTGWRTGFVPQAYRAGYTLHLIVYSGQPHERIATKYGRACGEAYPLSDRFLDDMAQLARTFRGRGRVYVTLFTEFQTYACTNNEWDPNSETNAYWRALKDQYRAALGVFHRLAPNSRVSLGWGGWQTRWDKPSTGGGRSMFKHFADVMRASDFQSFQAMQNDTNVRDVLAMTRTLGAYGPVLLAHYKPDSGSQSVFNADTRTMLTDAYLRKAVAAGLFGWSFMDERNLSSSGSTYSRIVKAIRRYGR
jgi:hypothetical protein